MTCLDACLPSFSDSSALMTPCGRVQGPRAFVAKLPSSDISKPPSQQLHEKCCAQSEERGPNPGFHTMSPLFTHHHISFNLHREKPTH